MSHICCADVKCCFALQLTQSVERAGTALLGEHLDAAGCCNGLAGVGANMEQRRDDGEHTLA